MLIELGKHFLELFNDLSLFYCRLFEELNVSQQFLVKVQILLLNFLTFSFHGMVRLGSAFELFARILQLAAFHALQFVFKLQFTRQSLVPEFLLVNDQVKGFFADFVTQSTLQCIKWIQRRIIEIYHLLKILDFCRYVVAVLFWQIDLTLAQQRINFCLVPLINMHAQHLDSFNKFR